MFDFDLSNGYVVLRIICGLFFFPQAVGKITHREGTIANFKAMGYPYPGAVATFANIFEFIVGAALILGIYTQWAAWLAAIFLIVAGFSVMKFTKKWLWHTLGCEYPFFWGICCIVVAMHT